MVTTAPKAVPAVPVDDGWVVKTAWVAAAGTIVKPALAPLVSPEEVAASVNVPAVSKVTPEKVATPADAVAVHPEAQLPVEGASVIEAVEEVSTLPLEFSTCTVTLKATPAVTLVEGTLVTTSLSGGGEELPQPPARSTATEITATEITAKRETCLNRISNPPKRQLAGP
jgi:hypothetical protein